MGNRNTRPHPGLEKDSQGGGAVGCERQDPEFTAHLRDEAPSSGPTAIDLDCTSQGRTCLIVPTSTFLAPRAVFSASLERSLSSGKRSVLRSSSSWTAGHDDNHPAAPSRRLPGGGTRTDGTIRQTRRGQSAPRSSTDGNTTGSIERQVVPGTGGTSTSPHEGVCKRTLDREAKARPSACPGPSRDIPRDKEEPERARRRTVRVENKTKQGGASRRRENTRAPRNVAGRGMLPMVKCWERGSEKQAKSEEERVQERVGSARGNAKASLEKNGNPRRSVAEEIIRGRMDGKASTGASRNGGVAFGRASSEGARARRKQQRGEEHTRSSDLDATVEDGLDSEEKSPPLTQLPTTDDAFDYESLSASSANSVCAQELSASSLPSVGTPATTADFIFEETCFEDRAASESLASPSDRNAFDIGGGNDRDNGGGGGRIAGGECDSGVRRKRRGHAPRQHSGSSDAFVQTRSVGRGLSNLMARIHEQEECASVGQSPGENVLGDRGSRDSEGEGFQVQEISDSDDGTLEPGATTVSSAVVVPWAAASLETPTVNVGHQRAALELRNLTLEREVEQLKSHLRTIRGEDVGVQRQGIRRPRPRPRPAGERVLVGAAGATTATGSTIFARRRTTKMPSPTLSGTHRSVAPLPLSDATVAMPRRGSGGGGSGGSVRSKGGAGRTRRSSDNYRGRQESFSGGGGHASDRKGGADHHRKHSAEGSVRAIRQEPSPPGKHDRRPPDGRPSVGAVVASIATTTASCDSSSSSSPARQLRTARLRSPDSVLDVPGAGGDCAYVGSAGGASLSSTRGEMGKESEGVGVNLGTATMSQMEREADQRPRSDLGLPATQESSRAVLEMRPLPRLRAEETERRRGALDKSRASKAPIYLGGVVSGIKHTLLGRRRNTGAINVQPVAPTSSNTNSTVSPVRGRGSGGGAGALGRGKDKIRPLPLHAIVDNRSPEPVPAEDAGNLKQADQDARKRDPRRPTRGEHYSSATIAYITAIATTTANELHKGQGSGGPGKAGREEPRVAAIASSQTNASVTACMSAPTAATVTPFETDPPERHVTPLTAASVVTGNSVAATTTVAEVAAAAAARSRTAEAAEAATGVVAGATAETGTRDSAGPGDETDAPVKTPAYGRWPATLDAQWAEVEFMLCHEVESEESLRYTAEATEAGLVFMEKLENKAQELGVLKGQLSRWLLPYNAETSVDEQQAATPRRFQESLQASSASSAAGCGVLTEQEAEYLTDGARKVRQLVRLKIADDNDLNTAKEALVTMAGFFVSISEEAARRCGAATAFDVLQERRAISPITRPPPLPSIPRPNTATPATTAGAKNDSTTATKRQATQQGGGRAAHLAHAVPISASSDTSARLGQTPRRTEQAGGGGEANQRDSSGSAFLPPATAPLLTTLAASRVDPTAAVDATSARTGEATATSGEEPVAEPKLVTPRDREHSVTVAPTASTARRGVFCARQVEGTASGDRTSRPRATGTVPMASVASGSRVMGDTERRASLQSAAEKSPGLGVGEAKGVAPPGSLERLKRRRKRKT